ncbi:iron-containing alcohol dehydrogenase [Actinomycetota bacterium]
MRFDDNYKFYVPIKFYSGYGRFSDLGKLSGEVGRKFLLVTGKSAMKKMGFTDKAVKMLRENGKEVVLFDQIDPNPTTDMVADGAALSVKEGCDAVIGLGGGSPMDAAKAIAVVAGNGGNIWDYRQELDTSKTLPIIAIPTTAGSGTDGDRYFVVTNKDINSKKGFATDYTYPSISILDPELTIKLPEQVTKDTAMDALGHSFEAFVSCGNVNAMNNLVSLNAIWLIFENLPRAVKNGKDKQARSSLMLAATMGGIAINHGGVGSPHGFSMAMGGMYNITHGQGIGIILPYAIEKAMDGITDKLGFAARFLGLSNSRDDTENSKVIVEKLHKFADDLGFPRKLSQIGIKKDNINDILKSCENDDDIDNDPGSYTPEETRKFLEKII